jgi:lipopolysaccharide export system protein LptC
VDRVTVAPLPAAGNPRRDRSARLIGMPARRAPMPGLLARRRWAVAVTKRLLPVAALALLSTVALWPELDPEADHARYSYRRGHIEPQGGQMTDATYHGVDEHGRPYTVTAATAVQAEPDRVNLTDPKGDISLESGNWVMIRSKQGVYLSRSEQLDLSHDVTLYRDDGTTLQTDTSAVDLKAGAAASADMVHAEGPFGTLDAQGFALTDRGALIQFTGPGHLVVNGRK